jgi:hypothetical protein
MTRGAIERRFGERERERLIKLFRALGSDNPHESEAARGRIDSLLREFGKTWNDLIKLLGGTIHTDLASNIIALGSSDSKKRSKARRNITDLLARHRKTWNDLAEALVSSADWARNSSADDPPRKPDLIGLIVHLFKDYVALKDDHEYVAVALWALHTHVYSRFNVTPRLALRSPTADSGKTTLLDVLVRLVAWPDKFDSISTAAIFRLIDQTHPTLLIDEADNLGLGLQPNGRLRAVFNSGHRNGGNVAIMERGAARKFSTFAPLALALPDTMGGLPRTLDSRSITIMMERHAGQRELRRFDINHPDGALDKAYEQILLWRRDVKLNPEPETPGVRNRIADNWRPLLSIADSLGKGEQAREAMLTFAQEYADADVKILLLSDIRTIFDTRKVKVDWLWSKDMLAALYDPDAGRGEQQPDKLKETELETELAGDWNEFRGVRGEQQPHKLKQTELAAMLREFKIRPRTIWPENRTVESKSAKGYLRSQFEEAWRAYCAADGTTAHSSNIRSLRLVSDGTA